MIDNPKKESASKDKGDRHTEPIFGYLDESAERMTDEDLDGLDALYEADDAYLTRGGKGARDLSPDDDGSTDPNLQQIFLKVEMLFFGLYLRIKGAHKR